ncbi:Protein of unknown function, partial [Gryllus bimaculatus]
QGWRHGGHAVRGVGAQLGHRAPPSGRAAPRGQGPHRRQGARHAREGPGGHAAEAASGALLVEPRQGRNLLPGDLPNRFRRPVRELPALPLAARGRQEIQLHRQIKEVAAPYVSPPELLRFWEHDIQRERQHNRSTLRLRSSRRSRRGPGQGPSPAHAFRRKVNDKRMQTQKTSNKSSTKRQVAIVKRKYVLLPEERKKRREKGRKRETFQPSLKLSS